MKTLSHDHISFELLSWARLLIFLENENAKMKLHLALITKKITEIKLLEKIELLQYAFIAQDNVLSIMRNDVAKQISDMGGFSNYGTEFIMHHLHFRKGMVLVENQFNKTKKRFIYFSEKNFRSEDALK